MTTPSPLPQIGVPKDPAALDSPDAASDETPPYPGALRIVPRPGLSPEQRAVERELVAIVQDHARADALYNALPMTRGGPLFVFVPCGWWCWCSHSRLVVVAGRLLSMDHARHLSPQYETLAQRLANTPATRNAAAAYVKNRLRRALEERREGKQRVLCWAHGV